jgi:uncharacterized protein (TIGR00369 family)
VPDRRGHDGTPVPIVFPPDAPFTGERAPEAPDWYVWTTKERGLFIDVFGKMWTRPLPDGRGQLRLWPTRILGNANGVMHGGAILGFIDMALFAGAAMAGSPGALKAVTLDCTTQFLAPVRLDEPVDALVEIIRETKRLVFVRGDVVQGDTRAAAFSGIIRKPEGG